MTPPKGYKHTELGILPQDWEVVRLGEVLEIGGGRDYKHLGFGDIPVYGTGGSFAFVDDFLYCGASVCIGRKGTIDKPLFVEGKFWIVDTLFFTHSFKNLIPKFLYYLASRIKWKKYNEASGVPSLSKSTIENLQIPLPPLAEQEKIAEILSTWDTQIQNYESLIKEKQTLKKGLCQTLLTAKTRLKGFSEDWEVVNVGKIFKITRGNVLSMDMLSTLQDDNNIYPVFSSKTKDGGLLGFYTEYLFEDCITWTTDGANAGEVNFRKGKFYCTNVCGVLISENGYCNQCVAEILNTKTKQYVSYVGNPKLMNNVMKEIKIRIPTNTLEQEKISEILSEVDREIMLLEQKLESLKSQKKGLMQNLLNGKVRIEYNKRIF